MLTEWTNFCCPQCRWALTVDSGAYRCSACQREYPMVFGIPDFRLFPDPYISFEDEYKKVYVLVDVFSFVLQIFGPLLQVVGRK